ncbi:hypothetical protein GG344DRAFT_47161, partial [Lentinula edodes]
MAPLPRPPRDVILNDTVLDTIRKNPHLFNITTPININRFRTLLNSHPNQDFVESVCTGFRQGFWPRASSDKPGTPLVLDRTRKLHDPHQFAFACEQRDKEINEKRFSPTFHSLLPGMQCVPVVVVPKPHTDKFRLAVDHSAEPFALNSLISRKDVKIKMDNLHDLGATL